MLIYYLLLVLIVGLAYPLCFKNPTKNKKLIYIGVVFVACYVISALRFGIGNDYFSYYKIFKSFIGVSFTDAFSLGQEPGFALINWLLQLMTHDIVVIHAVYSLLVLIPFAIGILRNSENPAISCFIFVTVTFFYTTMNFTRQAMAAGVIFLAWTFIKNKKHLLVILLTVLAAMFHYTALIFIVFYLLALIKPTKVSLGIWAAAGIFLFFTASPILNSVFDLIDAAGGEFSAYEASDKYFSAPLFLLILGILLLALTLAAVIVRLSGASKGFENMKPLKAFFDWLYRHKIVLGILGGFTTAIFIAWNILIKVFFSAVGTLGITRYATYRGSVYLSPLSPVFLVVPVIFLGVIIAACFLGWGKDKPEAKILLNFAVISMVFWVLITRFMLLERLSMYSYMFIMLSIPSIVEYYFRDKKVNAEDLAGITNEKKRREKIKELKTPQYRQLFGALSGVLGVALLIYNQFGMNENFHGVFPYMSCLIDAEASLASTNDANKAGNSLITENNELRYLLRLNNPSISYIMAIKGDAYSVLTSLHIEALKRLGITTDLSEVKNGALIVAAEGGKIIFEKYSESDLSETVNLLGSDIEVTSGSTATATLTINGETQSLLTNNTGINIVSFDTETTSFIDSYSIINYDGMLNETRYVEIA